VYDRVLAINPRSRVTPSFRSVNSILHRKRQACFPPTPATIDDVIIDGEWSRTWNDRAFLCKLDNAWGVAIFLSAEDARVLLRCTTIYIDGTFRTAPHPYQQMVTVHGLYMEAVVPLSYAPSTGKSVGQYRQIISGLRTSIRRHTGHHWPQPNLIICDFEISLITAVETELPFARIHCCYFHYNQSLWRRFSATGLVRAYRGLRRNDRRLRTCVQKIMALGFLPTVVVRQSFLTYITSRRVVRLQRAYPRLTDFLHYVNRVYIHRTATFKPPMWNVYDRTIDTRTNNHVEW